MISPQIPTGLAGFSLPLSSETLVDHGPAGEDYIAAIRDSVQHLVTLDIKFGGDAVSVYAMRIFRAVWHRLRQGAYRADCERDLHAAGAELAELTGWLLCDANRQLAARRVNHAAMTLAQISGDRSMGLFVTHNMSLQATYLRRPAEALELVQPMLDDRLLTSRLNSMFRLRVARAYAQMGQRSAALKVLDQAVSLFFDGVTDRDPVWSWWISERGINSATGAIYGSLGDWKAAISPLHSALRATPVEAHRDRHLYLCVLLHAQIELGDWREAERTAEKLVPLIHTVGSARPLARLRATIDQLNRLPGRRPRLLAATELVRPAIDATMKKRPLSRCEAR
ncbi:MAG: tetratricopeptide repeat protein [Pseudonocardiaceae bacterium]